MKRWTFEDVLERLSTERCHQMAEKAIEILETEGFDSNLGICVNCGAERDGVEPDAEGYECYECGEPAVFGVENVLLLA